MTVPNYTNYTVPDYTNYKVVVVVASVFLAVGLATGVIVDRILQRKPVPCMKDYKGEVSVQVRWPYESEIADYTIPHLVLVITNPGPLVQLDSNERLQVELRSSNGRGPQGYFGSDVQAFPYQPRQLYPGTYELPLVFQSRTNERGNGKTHTKWGIVRNFPVIASSGRDRNVVISIVRNYTEIGHNSDGVIDWAKEELSPSEKFERLELGTFEVGKYEPGGFLSQIGDRTSSW